MCDVKIRIAKKFHRWPDEISPDKPAYSQSQCREILICFIVSRLNANFHFLFHPASVQMLPFYCNSLLNQTQKETFRAKPFLLLFQLFDSVVQSRADLQERSNKSYTQIANSRHEQEMKLNWHNKYTIGKLITVCAIKHHLKRISIEKEAGRVYLFVQKWDDEICRWLEMPFEINFFK